MRPSREHDTTAARAHTDILPTLTHAGDDLRTLAYLGYEGESDTITVAPQHSSSSTSTRPALAAFSTQPLARNRSLRRRAGKHLPGSVAKAFELG